MPDVVSDVGGASTILGFFQYVLLMRDHAAMNILFPNGTLRPSHALRPETLRADQLNYNENIGLSTIIII